MVTVVDEERQLMNLITQSQVIRFLQQNLDLIGDKQNKPVDEIFGVIHEVYSVKHNQRAIDAFNEMVTKVINIYIYIYIHT